jgi:hypothetical protein
MIFHIFTPHTRKSRKNKNNKKKWIREWKELAVDTHLSGDDDDEPTSCIG